MFRKLIILIAGNLFKYPRAREQSLISIIVISSLLGCSPKYAVHVNGYEQPEKVNVAISQDEAIVAQWFYVRWYHKKLESQGFREFIDVPEYFLEEDLADLAPDTKAVAINLQVINPKHQKYRLRRLITVGQSTQEELVGDWTIREYRQAVIPGPLLPGQEVQLAAEIVVEGADGSQVPLLTIGEFTYRLKPGSFVRSN